MLIRILCFLFIFCGSQNMVCSAGDSPQQSFFKENISYDIYFTGYDGYNTVVKNVEIIGFDEINGKTFLVVRPSGFKLKEVDGFVLFEAVVAIFPNQEFKIYNVNEIKVK